MNRRNFVAASTAISVSAMSGLVGASTQPCTACMLSAPGTCVGITYTANNGAQLTVASVDALRTDAQWQQWYVAFESEAPFEDGTYTLRAHGANVADAELFLQRTGEKIGATITRKSA